MYDLLAKDMSGMNPRPYVIALTEDSANRFRELGMTPIVTDATYFMENLRKHMVAREVLFDENRVESVVDKRAEVLAKHLSLQKLDKRLGPALNGTS